MLSGRTHAVSIPDGLHRPFSQNVNTWVKSFRGVSIPDGLHRPFSHSSGYALYFCHGWFQSLTGSTGHLACHPSSIAWEATLCNSFRESPFLGVFCRVQCGHPLSYYLVNQPVECSESLCVETLSLRLSESSSIHTRNSTASAGGGPPTVSTLLTQFAHR